MTEQVRNSEGRVFKQAWGPRSYVKSLWDSIVTYMNRRGVIYDQFREFSEYSQITRIEYSRAYKYHETMARQRINEIRKANGLQTIPLKSNDWYHEDIVLEGLEDYKYGKVS